MRRARWLALAAFLVVAPSACDNDDIPLRPVTPPPPACPAFSDFLHTVAVGRPAGRAFGAAVSGDALFAAAGADGVHVLDISDPTHVAVLVTLPIADARAVDVEGDVLCVAAGDDGLVLVDVAVPAASAVTGAVDMPGCAVDVDLSGTVAYVANEDIGLVIVDVASPAAPAVRGIENTPGRVVAVAASGAIVYAADESNGLRIVNATDPAAPFVVKTVALPGAAKGVAVSGDIVAVAAREGDLQLVDVRTPGFAAVVGTLPTPRDAIAVAAAGAVVFVSEGSGGIGVVDISDPAAPRRLQSIGTAGTVRDLAVYGDRLAVAEETSGARVLAIARPVSPAADAHLAGGDIRSLAVLGDLIVVADASYGLRVFDAATRRVVGEIAVAGAPHDLALADSIAYVINSGGVPVVDLRDPASPAPLPALPAAGPFDGVAVAGEFAYLLASVGVLLEQRLDGTGTPRTVSLNGPFLPSLTIDGDLVYLPDRQGSVFVVSRSAMRVVSIIPMGSSAERVVFRTSDGPIIPVTRGWVAQSGLNNGRAGLEVYDFGNIIAPQLVGAVACAGGAVDVAFAGAHLAVAQGADGCEVFEFVGGNAARPVGYLPEPAHRVVAAGGRFAVAAGAAGLLLVDPAACLTPR